MRMYFIRGLAATLMLSAAFPTLGQTSLFYYFDANYYDYPQSFRSPVATNLSLQSSGSPSELRLTVSGPDTSARIFFGAPPGELLQVGSYEYVGTASAPLWPRPGLRFDPTPYPCATQSRGKFRILEIEFNASAALTKLAVDFSQSCGTSIGRIYGQLRFNSALPIDTLQREPNPFAFAPVVGAALGELVESAPATLQGLATTAPISVSGGEYSVNGGPYSTQPSTVSPGESIRLRVRASSLYNDLRSADVSIGTFSASFFVGSVVGDAPQPNGRFLIVVRQQLLREGTAPVRVYSAANFANLALLGGGAVSVQPDGSANPLLRIFPNLSATVPAPVGTFTGVPSQTSIGSTTSLLFENGAQSCASSAPASDGRVYEAEYSNNEVYGKVKRLAMDFVQTCTPLPSLPQSQQVYRSIVSVRIDSSVPVDYAFPYPDYFQFASLLDQLPGAVVESEVFRISGINLPVPISVTGGEYRIGAGAYTASPGMISPGQTLQLRATLPNRNNATQTVVVKIAGDERTFSASTPVGVNPQPNASSLVVAISQGLEPLGSGKTYTFSPSTGAAITARKEFVGSETVEITARASTSSEWRFMLGAANGAPLTVGEYRASTGGAPAGPAIRVVGAVGSCGAMSGEMKVYEIEFNGIQVNRLAADLTVYCSNSTWPLYAYLRVNSSVPVVRIADDVPAPLWHNTVRGTALPGEWFQTARVIPEAFDTPATVTVTGGEYSIAGAPFTSAPGLLTPGQSIRGRVRAGTALDQSTQAVLRVGGVPYTLRADIASGDFEQPPNTTVLGVEPGQLVLSDLFRLPGVWLPLAIIVQGGEFSVGGAPFQSTPGQLLSGQSLQFRVLSSTDLGTSRTMSGSIGGRPFGFTVVTRSTKRLQINVAVAGAGRIDDAATRQSCSSACAMSFDDSGPQSFAALRATPAPGGTFIGWLGCAETYGRACIFRLSANAQLTAVFSAQPAVQPYSLAGSLDIDGSGVAQLLAGDDDGVLLKGIYQNRRFSFVELRRPPREEDSAGVVDFNGDAKSDLIFTTRRADGFDDVFLSPGFSPETRRYLRQVRPAWDVQATGDLDGDGYGDIVWRYTQPNERDTGVSYIWFSNGSGVSQVRKRGGAPLDWRIIGTRDVNNDGAADLFYTGPEGQVRVLVAASNRTCANFEVGPLLPGERAVAVGRFSGRGAVDLVVQTPGHLQFKLMSLDTSTLQMPPLQANPDDPNAACAQGGTIPLNVLQPIGQSGSFKLVAVGDFDADGIDELVWMDAQNWLSVWSFPDAGRPPDINNLAGALPLSFRVLK